MTDRRGFLGSASLASAVALPAVTQSQEPAKDATAFPPGIRVPKFELLYECDATLLPAQELGKTVEGQRRIIPIAGGKFQGPRPPYWPAWRLRYF